MTSNSRLRWSRDARLLVTLAATAALLAGCGSGTMEPEDTAAENTMAADVEPTAETSSATRPGEDASGPESAAMTEATGESGMQGAAQDTASMDPASEPVPADEPAESDEDPTMSAAEPLPGSGIPVWEEGAVGELVPGLDGAEYPAYAPAVIGEVQEALSREGVYTGPINQVLDEPTIDAIGAFQEANDIHVSGVPSPMTRERLLENDGNG